MSARTALNKDLIMRRVSNRRQQLEAHAATSSTSPTTNSDANVRSPHESDVQTSARVEARFSHHRTFTSFTHDHNARLAAMAAVDKEVDATRQHLRSLLSHRNALAPISLLPPEILARVFHLLALDEPPCSYLRESGWIRTTHVCRHWREVALGDSSLWARISRVGSGLNSALISEMLARARNAPLEIDIDVIGTEPNPMHLFPPHLSHTRALRLHSLTEYDSEVVREIFSREAPALEHLELGFSVGHPITFQDLGNTTSFKGQAPKLRSFCITQVFVPWSFIPRGQLTQLKIIFLNGISYPGLSSLGNAKQFIDLLADCPALESLVLEVCLPRGLVQSSQGREVHLPHLSRLCVGDSSSSVTNLLKMLKIPSITTLHLRCVSDNVPSDNGYHILPAISSRFQKSVPVEFKSLRIALSHACNLLEIVASTSLPPSIIQPSRGIEVDMDAEAEFVLSFDGLSDVAHWREILDRACKMLPISNLEFLSITTPELVGPVNWPELFQRCTKLTTIQAVGPGTSGLIRALMPPTKKGRRKKRSGSSTSAMPTPGTIIFPKLTSLLLENLDFNEDKPPSGVLYDVLVSGLRQRKSTYNMPIRKMRVDHCVITVNRADALKKIVKEFCWDGEEGLVNEFDEFDDFGDYDSDFVEPGARWEDFFIGSTQAEWDWWENYSDGY